MSLSKRLSVFSPPRMAASTKSKFSGTDNRSSCTVFILTSSRPIRGTVASRGRTPREQLPYAREGDLQTFLDKSTRVLVENFGFQVKRRTKQKANADGASILNGPRERSDWGALFAQIPRRPELAR